MAIKRSVSSYSYQNLIFQRKMNWKDFLREVKTGLHTDGAEMIGEMFLDGYPFISDEFVYSWQNEMARYNMKSVMMDVYLDVLQFRNHIMNYEEAALRLKRDIVIASRLGFDMVRCLAACPLPIIEACLPTAEKYNVRIGIEVHAPFRLILPQGAPTKGVAGLEELKVNFRFAEDMMEMIDRTGTKHAGLIPDFGIFQYGLTPAKIACARRMTTVQESIDMALELRGTVPMQEAIQKIMEKYPQANVNALVKILLCLAEARIDDLVIAAPYIIGFHGKFYQMVEEPENPGHYYDPSIDYKHIFEVLKKEGFDGYISSEFEGQSDFNDLPDDQMVDEIEQVRRHHAMMQDYGAV